MRRILFALVLTLAAFAAVAAQTVLYEFNGVRYAFPQAHAAGILRNDGAGGLSWAEGLAPQMLAFTTDASCPPNWTEETALAGQYLVGLPSGGTVGGGAGTALGQTGGVPENRATGQHAGSASGTGYDHLTTTSVTVVEPNSGQGHRHGITDPSHRHQVLSSSSESATLINDWQRGAGGNASTSSDSAGISVTAASAGGALGTNRTPTVGNGGSGTGTNAPYVMLRVCSKN